MSPQIVRGTTFAKMRGFCSAGVPPALLGLEFARGNSSQPRQAPALGTGSGNIFRDISPSRFLIEKYPAPVRIRTARYRRERPGRRPRFIRGRAESPCETIQREGRIKTRRGRWQLYLPGSDTGGRCRRGFAKVRRGSLSSVRVVCDAQPRSRCFPPAWRLELGTDPPYVEVLFRERIEPLATPFENRLATRVFRPPGSRRKRIPSDLELRRPKSREGRAARLAVGRRLAIVTEASQNRRRDAGATKVRG